MVDYFDSLQQQVDKYRNKFSASQYKPIFKIIWWNLKYLLGNFLSRKNIKKSFNDHQIHILVILRGGVGDIIFVLRYLFELKRKYGNLLIIDITSDRSTDVVKGLLYKYNFINNINLLASKHYDCIFDVCRIIKINYLNERIAKISNSFYNYCLKIRDFQKENFLFFEHIPNHDFLAVKYSLIKGFRRENQIDILQEFNLLKSQFKLFFNKKYMNVLKINNLQDKVFITINCAVGDGDGDVNLSTRLWPIEYYNSLIVLIKKKYPQIKIVQLGSFASSKLKNTDLDLRGATNFEELKILLSHSALHIDSECGMVHIRHFLCAKKSVVLFGPTDEKFLGYPENINICQRNCPSPCDWVVPTWRSKCIKTGGIPECMSLIKPEFVMKYIVL